jgi:solute carrier family 35 protein C2
MSIGDSSVPSRNTSPLKSNTLSVSNIRSRSNTDGQIGPELLNPNSINNNTNMSESPRRSSILLQPQYNHRRSQSILSTLSNHVRNLSIDSTSNNNSNNIVCKSISNTTSPILQQKGKMSPENSPTNNKFSITSPVKVSGIAAGPDATNLILEINDNIDIDSFIHDVDNNNVIPKLLPKKSNSSEFNKKSKIKINLQNENGEYLNDDSHNVQGRSAKERELEEIGGGRGDEGAEEESGFFHTLYKHYPHLNITITSILLWYIFSMSISVYNRWMFSSDNLNFKFPIIITSVHQLILTILAILTLILFPKFRLSNYSYSRLSNKEELPTHEDIELEIDDEILIENEKLSYKMPIKEYITKILPCSLASAGDIGLGNTAFRFITLSLYTMVKTSALIFVLLWGVFFKLEKFTLRIFSIVCIMSFGVSMMIWGQHDSSNIIKTSTTVVSEDKNSFIQYSGKISSLVKRMTNNINTHTHNHKNLSSHIIFIGVSLVLLSACMSGLRWALTQIMLKKNKRTKNPILTMLYISPGMCIFLFLVGIIVEGINNFFNSEIWEIKGIFMTIILILIPGFLAFFMTISEYVLLQYASLLTLSIAGIFKELLTIFLSWVIFGDELSLVNIIGLIITFADIIWYNIYRFEQNLKKQNLNEEVDNEFVDIELNNINVFNK